MWWIFPLFFFVRFRFTQCNKYRKYGQEVSQQTHQGYKYLPYKYSYEYLQVRGKMFGGTCILLWIPFIGSFVGFSYFIVPLYVSVIPNVFKAKKVPRVSHILTCQVQYCSVKWSLRS